MAKKRQRGNGTGTVYPRKNKDGKVIGYRGSYFTPGGKRRYVSAKRKSDAERLLREAMTDSDRGFVFDSANQTVGAYMVRWLEDFAKANLASRTYHNYRLQIREHIVPAFGTMRLSKLDTPNIQALYTAKLQDGLKPSSIRYIHAVLHRATPLDSEQARALLDAAAKSGDRFECFWDLWPYSFAFQR